MACGKSNVLVAEYKIDWNSSLSLNNWMTQLDLICDEPYRIAFIGAISFFSFSLGSILFTAHVDKLGRKQVLVVSSAITPIGILILMIF
jgi:MFS family permease